VIRLVTSRVLLVMKSMTYLFIIRNKNLNSLKIFEIQGRRVCLNREISLGPHVSLGWKMKL
jgi:hypothetical protein